MQQAAEPSHAGGTGEESKEPIDHDCGAAVQLGETTLSETPA